MTPDNETLYGWHLLPLHLCRQHEEDLMNHPPNGPASDYTDTIAYKLLAGDPNARVVVSCECSSLFFTHPVAMCYAGLKSMEDTV